jgi:hypothetical protein
MDTNPLVSDVSATQEFIAGESILLHKWQDRIDQYVIFSKKAVQVIPELEPPFEGDQSEDMNT